MHRSDPPRLADRRLASGERRRLEPREPLERGEICLQQLAAPERPVGAVTRSVEDERERGTLLPVLGETGRGVRMVVLNLDQRQPLLVRPLRRQVPGMEIARDGGRLDGEHLEIEPEVVAERAVRRLRVEVAEVRGEERLTVTGDAERGLQLCAGGDERDGCLDRQRQRRRRVPARAAENGAAAYDRVLAAAVD